MPLPKGCFSTVVLEHKRPPETKPPDASLNIDAPAFEPSRSRPASPKLNVAAPEFKPSRSDSPAVGAPSSQRLFEAPRQARSQPMMVPPPPPPPPPPIDGHLKQQLQRLVAGKTASDQRVHSLLKEIELSRSRETALGTKQKAANEEIEAATRELHCIKACMGLVKQQLETTQRAHAVELKAVRRANMEETVALRDANDELLAQREQLAHQLHLMRRELATAHDLIRGPPQPLEALIAQHALPVPAPPAMAHVVKQHAMPGFLALPTATIAGVPPAGLSVVPQPRRAASVQNGAPIAKKVPQKHRGGGAKPPDLRETLKQFRNGQQAGAPHQRA